MKNIKLFITILIAILLNSCVSQKEYTQLQRDLEINQITLNTCEDNLKSTQSDKLILEANLEHAKSRTSKLESQLDYFKSTNTNLLERLSDLTSSMQRKDSLNLVLVMNLKRSLDDFDDEDINIEVKKGVVYVSISDKMLFRSGSYKISDQAKNVIGKIAKIINDHKELDILVEGHTDTVPISTECMVDNWDLSVKRATSIVRLMQTDFGVESSRMTAGGRSEFLPKTTNETVEGRAKNRRTEIVILPKLDEFFALLEPPVVEVK
jgi:chemotaxis protein MotB